MRRVLFATAIVFGLATSGAGSLSAASNTDTYRQLDLLMEVFERIRSEYVEEVDDKEVLTAAIEGMLASLDPHSSFVGPENFEQMQVQTRGEYGGLGIEVTMENELVRVVSPIDDTPADRAGIEGGDYITHIDGDAVLGMTMTDALDRMRGAPNTEITITIVREGVDDPFDVTLVREVVKLKSVRHEIMRDAIGYVRISSFNEQTASGLRESMAELRDELGDKLQGIVLDLRNNPGGLLDQAIAVSDAFLDRGEIVSTRYRRESDNQRWHAASGDLAGSVPVIVLVNAYSASASEIVAGALKDHRRATLVGVRTFGKGTVQSLIPLGPKSLLRLTTGRYYTPSGRSIQELGIEPDIEVQQLQVQTADARAAQPRRERDLEGHLANDQTVVEELLNRELEQEDGVVQREQPVLIEEGEEPVDYQLNYALDLLEGVFMASQQQAMTTN